MHELGVVFHIIDEIWRIGDNVLMAGIVNNVSHSRISVIAMDAVVSF